LGGLEVGSALIGSIRRKLSSLLLYIRHGSKLFATFEHHSRSFWLGPDPSDCKISHTDLGLGQSLALSLLLAQETFVFVLCFAFWVESHLAELLPWFSQLLRMRT
jgi:hypothetical protein